VDDQHDLTHQGEPVTTPETPITVPATMPITIHVNLADLLALEPDITGYDNYGDPIYDRSVANQLRELVVAKLTTGATKQIMDDDFRKVLREQIKAHVDTAVLAALDEPFTPTDGYGSPKGQPTTLRSNVAAAISSWGHQADGYGGKNNLQKWITEAVDRAFAKELKATVDSAKQQVLDQLQAHAAKAMADAIAATGRA
jgi:hypothetical protein